MTWNKRCASGFAVGDLIDLRSATFRTRPGTVGVCVNVQNGSADGTVEVLFVCGTLERFSFREADWYLERLGSGLSLVDPALRGDRRVLMLAYLEGRFDPQFEAAQRLRGEQVARDEELEAVLAASG